MLGRTNSLLFPRLVHIEEINKAHLYKLDWSGMEGILRERHEESGRSRDEQFLKKWGKPLGAALCPPKDPPFFKALPNKCTSIVDDSVFALNADYRREIIRNAKRAVEERSIERSFDTSIRDMCQQTVEAHVEVAFRLLADCVFDVEENSFSRDYVFKFMLPRWMLFRFWFHQTGWGLVWEKAKLNELEDNLNDIAWCERVGSEYVTQYQVSLRNMQYHMDKYKIHIGYPSCCSEKDR